jgi:hypothetical protein
MIDERQTDRDHRARRCELQESPEITHKRYRRAVAISASVTPRHLCDDVGVPRGSLERRVDVPVFRSPGEPREQPPPPSPRRPSAGTGNETGTELSETRSTREQESP